MIKTELFLQQFINQWKKFFLQLRLLILERKKKKKVTDLQKLPSQYLKYMNKEQKEDLVEQLTEEMHKAAKDLEFEKAANLRDEIHKLKKMIG